MIQYFRIGNFKTHTKNYNIDFQSSNIDLIEHNPQAYVHLVYALFLSEGLGFIRLVPTKIDDKDAAFIIDEET